MTKSEALELLRRYEREEIDEPRKHAWRVHNNPSFDKAVYERYLVSYLRDVIIASKESPLEAVAGVYRWVDDCMSESRDEKPLVWRNFTAMTEHCTGEILRYMRASEHGEKREF